MGRKEFEFDIAGSDKSDKNHDKESLSDSLNSTSTGVQRNLSASERSKLINELAVSRGTRFRKIRETLSLSIDNFAKLLNVNFSQIGRIERGEICMSEYLAEYFLKRIYSELNKNNYHSQQAMLKWLLYGYGEGRNPDERNASEAVMLKKFSTEGISVDKYFDHKDRFTNGISTEDAALLVDGTKMYFGTESFRQFNRNMVTTLVKDKKMEPVYQKGDLVGGVKISKEFYNLAHGYDCIIELPSKKGVRLVRRFFVDQETGNFLISGYHDNIPQILTESPSSLSIINLRQVFNMKIKPLRASILFNKDNLLDDGMVEEEEMDAAPHAVEIED